MNSVTLSGEMSIFVLVLTINFITMTKRSPIAVFFLSIFTFGIYIIVWRVKTKGEMNRLGANIPTAWLLIIPFVNIWWLWEYAEGVEKITNKGMSQVVAFILLILLSAIGDAVIQESFNKINLVSEPATA
jgi:hypothetical protein